MRSPRETDSHVKNQAKIKCAAYLLYWSGETLPNVNLSRLSLPGFDVPTAVVGNKTIQEMIQMGKNTLTIIRRKRTKQYASIPLACLMERKSARHSATGHRNMFLERGSERSLRRPNQSASSIALKTQVTYEGAGA